jgi:ring-1,2-phenylacetyl-CoA epoxidase subunit PaaA
MNKLLVRSKDEIPDVQYRKMLLTLMERQAGREISGAEVYGQCLIFAPTYDLKMDLVRFVREEFRHYKLIADLMAELGVDLERFVRGNQRGEARFTGNPTDVVVEDWTDAILFNFMTDRAATFQLAEYAAGSYLPLAKANQIVLREEAVHKSFGEVWIENLCRSSEKREEIQRRFPKWFAGAMRIFGRPNTPGSRYCIEAGLKQRDPAAIAADFLNSLRPILGRCGLRFPRRDEVTIEIAPELDLATLSVAASTNAA